MIELDRERQQLIDAFRTVEAAYRGLETVPEGVRIPKVITAVGGWEYWPLWDAPKRVDTSHVVKIVIGLSGGIEGHYRRVLRIAAEPVSRDILAGNTGIGLPDMRPIEERIERLSQVHRIKHHAVTIIDAAISEVSENIQKLDLLSVGDEHDDHAIMGSVLRIHADALDRWKRHERIRLREMQRSGNVDVSSSNYDRLIKPPDLGEMFDLVQEYVDEVFAIMEPPPPPETGYYDFLGYWYVHQMRAAGATYKDLLTIRYRNRSKKPKPGCSSRTCLSWAKIVEAKILRDLA